MHPPKLFPLLALLGLALFALPSLATAATPARPNIVLIVSDDQGYGDSTAYGKTDLETPVMDAIGRAGIRFTHFRVNPLCAPTRASVMTGLYSVESGMWRGPGEGAGNPEKSAKKKNRKAAKRGANRKNHRRCRRHRRERPRTRAPNPRRVSTPPAISQSRRLHDRHLRQMAPRRRSQERPERPRLRRIRRLPRRRASVSTPS